MLDYNTYSMIALQTYNYVSCCSQVSNLVRVSNLVNTRTNQIVVLHRSLLQI